MIKWPDNYIFMLPQENLPTSTVVPLVALFAMQCIDEKFFDYTYKLEHIVSDGAWLNY